MPLETPDKRAMRHPFSIMERRPARIAACEPASRKSYPACVGGLVLVSQKLFKVLAVVPPGDLNAPAFGPATKVRQILGLETLFSSNLPSLPILFFPTIRQSRKDHADPYSAAFVQAT